MEKKCKKEWASQFSLMHLWMSSASHWVLGEGKRWLILLSSLGSTFSVYKLQRQDFARSRAQFKTCFLWQQVERRIYSRGMSHYCLLLLGITLEGLKRWLILFWVHWEPPSPSTNSKAGPCNESWEMIEGNPLNLRIGGKFNWILWYIKKLSLIPCSSRRKRCPDVSDERFWGPIGGWLEGLRRRRGRYGTAKGQRGVKSASARAVGQARK